MFNMALNQLLINLFKTIYEKNSGVVRLNQKMSKLLRLSKFFQEVASKLGSCFKIAPLCFGHAEHYIMINGCRLLKILERVSMF